MSAVGLSGPVQIFGIDPMQEESVPSHQLGTIGVTSDGCKFRYVKNNATNAAVAGELQQRVAEDTALESIAVATTAVGATSVTTTGTVTVTVNQLADGYLVGTAEGGTGNGYRYRIKSHPAATAAVCTFQLYEPIKVAFNTSTQVDLVQNPYSGVIQNPTSATGNPLGVAVIPLTASYYGWLQVSGPGIVKADAGGAITVGDSVVASNQTAGCAENATGAQAVVGVAITGIASAEFGMCHLTIE